METYEVRVNTNTYTHHMEITGGSIENAQNQVSTQLSIQNGIWFPQGEIDTAFIPRHAITSIEIVSK